jgi:biopolymer transport protein ExbD
MAAMQARFEDRPMGEMNTTPLIDVMLVLLIMFIMTIPMATNALQVELPTGKPVGAINPIRNSVQITSDDRILWNGARVSQPQLAGLLHRTRQLPVEPELQFEPDGQASYALAAEVTNVISRSGVTNFGFVGNEQYSQFARAEGSAAPRK